MRRVVRLQAKASAISARPQWNGRSGATRYIDEPRKHSTNARISRDPARLSLSKSKELEANAIEDRGRGQADADQTAA